MTRVAANPVRLVAVAAVGLAAVVVVAVLLSLGGGPSTTIDAHFAGTGELRAGDPVRIHGIDVGKVTALHLEPAARSVDVTMRLDRDDIALMRDARASVRSKTLFGGSMYVDVDPGSPGVGQTRSTDIPRGRTTTQVEFDDVLQPLDGPSAARLQRTIAELKKGLDDPQATRRAIDKTGPALKAFSSGARPFLGEQTGDLRGLVRSTGRVVRALGSDERSLRDLVDGAAGTLRVTAARRPELGRLLAAAPTALAATTTTARRIDATLPLLDPLVSDLRPGARKLAPTLVRTRPALDEASALLDEARPLLTQLRPAVASLASASRMGKPLVAALEPTMRRLDDDLLPWLARPDKGTGRRTYEMIGATLAAASSSTSEFDGEGYWIRFPAIPGERPLLSAPCSTFLTDPTAAEKVRCDELESMLGELFGGRKR